MKPYLHRRVVTINPARPIWNKFFMVAPLIVVGTREADEGYDLAPKHMTCPLGWENYFSFVCTPRHHTYQNAKREGVFTVSFPVPSQVIITALTASPHCGDEPKRVLSGIRTFPAEVVDGVLVEDAYLFFECELDRIIDGFGENSLIVGKIVAAHAQEECLRSPDKDDQDVIHGTPLFAYLPPGRFARIADTHAFPFPADFAR